MAYIQPEPKTHDKTFVSVTTKPNLIQLKHKHNADEVCSEKRTCAENSEKNENKFKLMFLTITTPDV